MIAKTVVLFLFLFCAQVCRILGQNSSAPFPKPSPNAQLCMNEMNQTGVLGECQDDAMNTWNPSKRGQSMGTMREFCCEIYGEIDCIINATNSGKYCHTIEQPMIEHQIKVFKWWHNNDCMSIKYHGGMCNPEDGPSTKKPDPDAKPTPSPDAQACINELTGAGILSGCRNSAMALWDPLKRGQQTGSVREMCCESYGEIDCLMNATENGYHCKTTKQAMLNHQRTLFSWLQKGVCLNIKYHAGMCDPDQHNNFPPPQPLPVAKCFSRIYQKVNHCESKARKDWNVKSTDSYYSQSVCCSKYQVNDCYVNAAKQICDEAEYTQFNKYYHDMSMTISKINCTDNQYQSFNCFSEKTDFPPPAPPAAASCTDKIFDKLGVCSDHVFRQWNDTLSKLTGRNACCGNWDLYDCILNEAQDKCTLLELSEFEQYYNFLAQTITKKNCTAYGYHSKSCKSVIRNPTSEVSSCMDKINADSCQNSAKNTKWRIQGMNKMNANSLTACCQQLSINKCLETSAMDKCNVTELNLFQKYLIEKTNINCGANQIALRQCHLSGSTALHSNMLIVTITIISILSLFKF